MAGRVVEPLEQAMGRLLRAYKTDFPTALGAFMEAYRFADWAVIARAVDGNKIGTFECGDGENAVGTRERGMLLVGELEDLKDVIIQYFRKRQEIAK